MTDWFKDKDGKRTESDPTDHIHVYSTHSSNDQKELNSVCTLLHFTSDFKTQA